VLELPTVALSLTQPWGHAILHLGKNVENRTWNTRFRGSFWLHASKGCKRDEYALTCERILALAGLSDRNLLPTFDECDRGGIIGMARISDVMRPRDDLTLFSEPRANAERWHFPSQFGFVLADIKPSKFVPCLGALGFWKVPSSVLDELREAA
jgi:hypothetical protein